MSLTYGELRLQYDAMAKTTALLEKEKGALSEWISASGAKQFAFVGCGSSYSVAKSLADSAYMHLGVDARAFAAGDILLHSGRYAGALQGALVVTVSRSGSTSEIVKAIGELKKRGCGFHMLSISCVCDSPLDRLADRHIDLPWAFDESVCQTRTVSCLYYAGLYLISCYAGNCEILSSLTDVVEKGPAFFNRIEPLCKEIASGGWERAVALGDAEIAGLCEEGALAFNEICQIPSNFYHLLDARHGPMVLISPRTLVIAAISDADNNFESDMLRDLSEKGSTVIAVSAEPVSAKGVINICWGGKLHHAALGFPFILACQLITYYKSALTGADPDKPDGLEPWISL